MSDIEIPDLSFPQISQGSHGAKWDLLRLAYRGGSQTSRRYFYQELERGAFGALLDDRLPLLQKMHEQLSTRIELGGKSAAWTAISVLRNLSNFAQWADSNQRLLTLQTAKDDFIEWSESLVARVRVEKSLSVQQAYSYASTVAGLLAEALDISGGRKDAGRALLSVTRIQRPNKKIIVGPSSSAKQPLSSAIAFGHLLTDICNGLTNDALRGQMPLHISCSNGTVLMARGFARLGLKEDSQRGAKEIKRTARTRAPLRPNESAIVRRPTLLNLRIEAELLTFIMETSMNLHQAATMTRAIRWQTDGDDVIAYRVFKGRRHGEALFRCFRSYRRHWDRYLAWLKEVGLDKDTRLFPIIHHKMVIPSLHSLPRFQAVRSAALSVGVDYVSPRALRKARVNFVLRKSGNPALTAQMAAHSKETLHRSYEEPNHHSAASEIVRFHNDFTPVVSAPGAGLCANGGKAPLPSFAVPRDAPRPDCISAEGCLFCQHHRDVLSFEYCWRLVSHRHLKKLEGTLHRPARTQARLPPFAIADRITAKLDAIAGRGEAEQKMVSRAHDEARALSFHPHWAGHIDLLEVLLELA